MRDAKYRKLSTEDFNAMCDALKPGKNEITPTVSFQAMVKNQSMRLGENPERRGF